MKQVHKLKKGMSQVEACRSTRKMITAFNPVTKVIPDKKTTYKRKDKFGKGWE